MATLPDPVRPAQASPHQTLGCEHHGTPKRLPRRDEEKRLHRLLRLGNRPTLIVSSSPNEIRTRPQNGGTTETPSTQAKRGNTTPATLSPTLRIHLHIGRRNPTHASRSTCE